MAHFLLHIQKKLSQTLKIGVCLCACAIFFACEDVEEEAAPETEAVERPLMLFTDTTLLDFYEREKLSWKVKTAYLERWAGTDKIFARPILVDIFDSLGERSAFLRADSGTLDSKMDCVYAYGHVYALTPKGASVRADSLLWHKRDDLVKTESYVRVVSEDGDVLQGQGFESDAKMEDWRILKDVTGIFQDAANRIKEEDEKQNEENLEEITPHPAPKAAPRSTPRHSPMGSPRKKR